MNIFSAGENQLLLNNWEPSFKAEEFEAEDLDKEPEVGKHFFTSENRLLKNNWASSFKAEEFEVEDLDKEPEVGKHFFTSEKSTFEK